MPGAEELILRRLLTAIEGDAGVSQRRLSVDMGIAVGSVNWYLKRCLNKGFIKLKHAPVKRYLYYLTPKGLEEKARLTGAFLQQSLELYRLGRQECSEFVRACVAEGKLCIFLAGDSDLAEIACISGLGTPLRIKAVIDETRERASCVDTPVYRTLVEAIAETGKQPDVILLTNVSKPERCYNALAAQVQEAGLPPHIIHVLHLLNFKPAYK